MNSTDVFTNAFSSPIDANPDPDCAQDHPAPIRVKQLSERDRRSLLMHFLALAESDRVLRFGAALQDEMITRYVQRLDFGRDAVFGVYDNRLDLVGVGHLVYVLRDALPALAGATAKERLAEFGISVSESARGLSIGSKLFARAAIHCRNEDVDTLFMHCLATNQIMIHLARKAGMEIHYDYGEADAYLTLPPANPGSALQEAVEEQVAAFDYSLKVHTRAATEWLENLPAGNAGSRYEPK